MLDCLPLVAEQLLALFKQVLEHRVLLLCRQLGPVELVDRQDLVLGEEASLGTLKLCVPVHIAERQLSDEREVLPLLEVLIEHGVLLLAGALRVVVVVVGLDGQVLLFRRAIGRWW